MGKIRPVPGITNDMRYWLTKSLWGSWYNARKKKIRFSGGEREKVKHYVTYASTVFYAIEDDKNINKSILVMN